MPVRHLYRPRKVRRFRKSLELTDQKSRVIRAENNNRESNLPVRIRILHTQRKAQDLGNAVFQFRKGLEEAWLDSPGWESFHV